MPIIEYKCSVCDEKFIKIYLNGEKVSDALACLKCGAIAKKIISAAGFVLKGPGFYKNDYKNNT
jgi:putative FmdB family regulatory protein